MLLRKVVVKENPLNLDAYVNGDPKVESFPEDIIKSLAIYLEDKMQKEINSEDN